MKETDLNELKRDVYKWSTENFGVEQPYQYPLMGVAEEFGELITSVLKQKQGIDDEHKYQDRVGEESEKDAVGDMVVYLVDFCARFPHTLDIEGEYQNRKNGMTTRENEVDSVFSIGEEIGMLFSHEDKAASDQQMQIAVAMLVVKLEEFCEHRGFTLDECIEAAWGEVQEREWDSDVEAVQ